MKFKGTFQIPRFEMADYKHRLKQEFAEELAKAARVWLGAVQPLIPVWSGASRATLQHLADVARFRMSVSPSRGVASRVSLGLSSGEGTFHTEGFDSGVFLFTYSTTLKHLVFNEFNNANDFGFHLITPGPYHFQEAGLEAFRQVAPEATLPNPFRSIKTTKVRV